MKKVISIYQSKYEHDLDTKEGNDLYSAWELISMFGMPATPEDQLPPKAKEELNSVRVTYDNPHPYNCSYEAAANLCLAHDSVLAHIIAFQAFKNLPAAYRPEAIKEMKKAIAMGHNKPFDIYGMGLLQSQEGDQADALDSIAKAIDLAPQNPLYYRWAAEVLVKMNELDQALSILYAYRDGEYYRAEKVIDDLGLPLNTRIMIDSTIKDIEDKKARGYVYRPRKKKE